MPKRMDKQEVATIYGTYKEQGSMEKTAKLLGIPLHKVKRSVYNAQGICPCGRTPRDGYATCDVCLERARKGSKKRRKTRKRAGVCTQCQAPLDPTSTTFCTEHLLKNREQGRDLRHYRVENGLCQFCKEPAVDGRPLCEKHLVYAFQKGVEFRSRNSFGGLYFDVLERDSSTCQICGNSDKKIEVHHVNGRKNTMKNLISLCVHCHKAVTFLNYCDKPDAVFAFFLAHPQD